MKAPALLLAGTLALNVALLAFALRPVSAPAGMRRSVIEPSGDSTPIPAAGGGVAASASRTPARDSATGNWAALETDDLRELASRLRTAGFSPAVIRAIIGARIEALFAPRMKEIFDPLQNVPAWKQDPRAMMSSRLMEERNQLIRDRARMLREILEPNESGSPADASRRRQFGDLPAHKIELVQRINDDYAEMMSQVRAAMQGITLPEDREKLALLERERQADLAAVLTPQELEEFELRASPITARLRPALTVMDATEEEFRALFTIHQEFNDRINPVGSGPTVMSTTLAQQRRDAQVAMFEKIKSVLPAERYAEYMRAQDREYQMLRQLAQRENVSADAAARAFDLRAHYAAESNRIHSDGALSNDQKRDTLRTLARDARVQLISTLGVTAGTAYVENSQWLTFIEGGGAVTFQPGGGTSFRPLPPPAPVR